MRRYVWVVLLASAVGANPVDRSIADIVLGVHDKSDVTQEVEPPKLKKPSPFQPAIGDKSRLLRGTFTEKPHSATIEASSASNSRTNNLSREHQGEIQVGDFPWENRASGAIPKYQDTAQEEDQVKIRALASVYVSDDIGDLVLSNELLGAEEPTQSIVPEGGEGEMHTMTVNDEIVRWDQNDCTPCAISTLKPTLPPIHPRNRNDNVERLPTVTDVYDTWEDVKEEVQPTAIVPSGDTEKPLQDADDEDEDHTHCVKVITANGESYDCNVKTTEDPVEPNGDEIHCTKVVTDYGETYECSADKTRPGGPCPADQQSIGVAGWNHDGCVKSGNVCVAEVSDGDCPDGAYCALIDGVQTFQIRKVPVLLTSRSSASRAGTTTDARATCALLIGVAGWDHDGCVKSGNVCVANINGDCPSGAHCAWLDTGVYGCKDGDQCSSNEHSIGVVGWDHDGCVESDNVCRAQVSHGDCPGGSYCALLGTGVYGCVSFSTTEPLEHGGGHSMSSSSPIWGTSGPSNGTMVNGEKISTNGAETTGGAT
ncbi:LOW QUALITY PROTEIN: hypothetical protein PHMEG_000694 [Phytophthora megakarya]|uniref:Uncharacterized protein n=1 Tax=Phytophthora megakarya TaxID=4795 RepID=A0A225X4K8_9STRA|nr:LOW QUALITY PROTEIN: hypothetical protein PHMEG_000694 [Phytophthora megakarya]